METKRHACVLPHRTLTAYAVAAISLILFLGGCNSSTKTPVSLFDRLSSQSFDAEVGKRVDAVNYGERHEFTKGPEYSTMIMQGLSPAEKNPSREILGLITNHCIAIGASYLIEVSDAERVKLKFQTKETIGDVNVFVSAAKDQPMQVQFILFFIEAPIGERFGAGRTRLNGAP